MESKASWRARVGAKIEAGGGAEVLDLKPGVRVRVRFLQEIHEGVEFLTHKNLETGKEKACLKLFGRECPYHDGGHEDVTRVAYTVWDYGGKTRRAALIIARPWSLQVLLDADAARGTIMDRDFTFERRKRINIVAADKPTSFDCPQDQPFSAKRMLDIIASYFRVKGEAGR